MSGEKMSRLTSANRFLKGCVSYSALAEGNPNLKPSYMYDADNPTYSVDVINPNTPCIITATGYDEYENRITVDIPVSREDTVL